MTRDGKTSSRPQFRPVPIPARPASNNADRKPQNISTNLSCSKDDIAARTKLERRYAGTNPRAGDGGESE